MAFLQGLKIMSMVTVTIPKKLAKQGDLVVVPRKEYEELLRLRSKVIPEVPLTAVQKQKLRAARKRLAQSEFLSLDELRKKLGIKD